MCNILLQKLKQKNLENGDSLSIVLKKTQGIQSEDKEEKKKKKKRKKERKKDKISYCIQQ